MKVIRLPLAESGRVRFRVYGENRLPFTTINDFLVFMENKGNAPNTIRSYAYDLVGYFKFLRKTGTEWMSVSVADWVNYIHHLRCATSDDNVFMMPVNPQQVRSASTINRALTSANSFYKFQYAKNDIEIPHIEEFLTNPYTNDYKALLSFASRARPKSAKRAVKLIGSQKQSHPKPLEVPLKVQIELIRVCCNKRDKLMLMLLIETGMRIGQVLGLRHEDIVSYENKINIVYRLDNVNGAYAKTICKHEVDISNEWLNLYTDFLITDYDEVDSDYVFTNLYSHNSPKDTPLNYSTVQDIFTRLSKKTGAKVTAHMFRHTHATDLIRAGVPIEIVSKRLGHKSIETTKTIYEHLTSEDIKNELKKHTSKCDFLQSLYSFDKEITT